MIFVDASALIAVLAQEPDAPAITARLRRRCNMGDCFAYACAKSAGARLLYKGNDFALTDLA